MTNAPKEVIIPISMTVRYKTDSFDILGVGKLFPEEAAKVKDATKITIIKAIVASLCKEMGAIAKDAKPLIITGDLKK